MSEQLIEVRLTVEEAEALMSVLQPLMAWKALSSRVRNIQSGYKKLSAALLYRQGNAHEKFDSDSSHRDDAPPLGWSDV